MRQVALVLPTPVALIVKFVWLCLVFCLLCFFKCFLECFGKVLYVSVCFCFFERLGLLFEVFGSSLVFY